MRARDSAAQAANQLRVAAFHYTSLGKPLVALELVNEHSGTLSVGGTPAASHAHYLRSRILMDLGEQGPALRALEDAMEASHSPPLMVLVDESFESLRGMRRFQTILRYNELAERRVSTTSRPWRPES